jgi:hypothetical protein
LESKDQVFEHFWLLVLRLNNEHPNCLKAIRSDNETQFRNVSDGSSPEGLSLRVDELENALCNQDKLLGMVFRKNKKLNLELESSFSEIASLQSMHDDMSAKPCDRLLTCC